MQVKKYCRMLQGEHSETLSTFIKLPFVIKISVLSIFEWSLKTGFTVTTKIMPIVSDGSSSISVICQKNKSKGALLAYVWVFFELGSSYRNQRLFSKASFLQEKT